MGIRRLRFGIPAVAGAVALLGAVPALAYVCHPDVPGTRTLAVHGTVLGYSVQGSSVRLRVRGADGCTRLVVWNTTSRAAAGPASACSSVIEPGGRTVVVPARAPAVLAARNGPWRAVSYGEVIRIFRNGSVVRTIHRTGRAAAAKLSLESGRLLVLARPRLHADRPSRLEVYALSSGRLLHDWPLLARPKTLAVHDGVAAFRAGSVGLYVIRLADGRQTFISPVRRHDTPQIGSRGLVYESALMRSMRGPSRVVFKFLPTAAVQSSLAATVDSMRTRWPIRSFAMDGPRVAVVLDAPSGSCDQVRYWNIPWHYFQRINMADDLTCSRQMSIRSVSLGGLTAEWVAVKNHVAKVVMSNSIACIERVIATGNATARILLAGAGSLLGVGRLPGSALVAATGFVDPTTHAFVLSPKHSALALAADRGRLATLGANGLVTLRNAFGDVDKSIAVAATSRTIALRGRRLVALTTSGRLEVWNTSTGRRQHVWRVPAGTRSAVDLQFGIAVFTAGRSVYGMDVSTGRTAVLARAGGAARTQIEPLGVAYTYNRGGHGFLRLVPMSSVERSLRLS
jgi:hypothetical protein